MTRNLTITRKKGIAGGIAKWGALLDGVMIAKLDNGQTQSFRIDEQPHHLEIIMLSVFGKPTLGIDPATAMIMAGTDDCVVTLSLAVGLTKNKIMVDCTYKGSVVSESDFVEAVTAFIVNVFNGDAILKRLNDPNNRRNDLGIDSRKDGVHIWWEAKEITMGKNWSTGRDAEIIPYEAAGVTMPKENLTEDLLNRLDASIKNGILTKTRFVKNEYGCFALGNKKSSLY